MICGLGLDVIEITRICRSMERFGESFLQKILTVEEITFLQQKARVNAQSVAARFAAKEAAVKALGTGFTKGIGFQHIAIHTLSTGQPFLHFYGPAADVFQELGAVHSHLSITHSRDTAAAVVILTT